MLLMNQTESVTHQRFLEVLHVIIVFGLAADETCMSVAYRSAGQEHSIIMPGDDLLRIVLLD